MRVLDLALIAGAAVALLAAAPITSHAQPDHAAVAGHGDWTLGQREDWLRQRIDASRDNGALDHSEFDRVNHQLRDIRHQEDAMRDTQNGQLTDNQTSDLEARLDDVAARIHWANAASFQRPW